MAKIESEVCDRIGSAIAIVGSDGMIRECNRHFEESFLDEKAASSTLESVFGSGEAVDGFLGRMLATETGWSGKTEGDFAGWIDCYPLEETGDRSYLIFFDTSGRREDLILEASGQGRYDSVTGLPNLTMLQEVLQERYLCEGASDAFGALFLVAFDDIYRFDHRGEGSMGDKVLVQLAEKLGKGVGEEDFLAYIGDDKFAYVCHGVRRVDDAERIARKLLLLNAEPMAVDGELFYLNLSVGIAFYPFDGEEALRLVRQADWAMREAKLSGWNRFAFCSQLRSDAPLETLEVLRRALPEAIERGDLYFLYQPQYSLERKRFIGAEMLARWRHPELGDIRPEVFLPLAEQTGMIRFLTHRALMAASKTFEKLKAIQEEDFSLSVNLSPSLVYQQDFLEELEFYMKSYALEDSPLHLEITENIFAHNMTVMRQTLEKLRAMGIKVEIDDYGTGYTSLSTLIELPVNILKIDREYVKDLDRNTKTRTLFRALLQTAEALGLDIVVEGVEREEEKAVIESIRPVVIQGWFYAEAMDETALLALLKKR